MKIHFNWFGVAFCQRDNWRSRLQRFKLFPGPDKDAKNAVTCKSCLREAKRYK